MEFVVDKSDFPHSNLARVWTAIKLPIVEVKPRLAPGRHRGMGLIASKHLTHG